jgi:hypothetical protein
MALVHNSYTLAAATVTAIATVPLNNPRTSVIVTNADSASVFLGDSSVSTGASVDRGIKVATNTNQEVWLNGGDTLYAISAAGTSEFGVAVLYSLVVPA